MKKILSYIKENALEVYVAVLLIGGLSLLAWLYVDWKLALTVFILTQLVPALLALRRAK